MKILNSFKYAIHCSLLIGWCMISISCQKEMKDLTTPMPVETRHSGEGNIFVSEQGDAFLSWIEYSNDSLDVLQFSKLSHDGWTAPKVISQGTDWFVNWADFPSLVASSEQVLLAHWLQKSAHGTYDYDVKIAISSDGGNTWGEPLVPHRDSINAEHGFVSMVPTTDGQTFVTWLDGRNTKQETNNAMTLRAAVINSQGELTQEAELDDRVCDCCQTAAAVSDKGPIVVYRDRSEDEIRDISIVRSVNGQWSDPKKVYDDQWKIAGCPVNGPSIDALGSQVVVAWFTWANEIAKVSVAFSSDFGETFGSPITIDDGSPIGRVDVLIHEDQSVSVSWIEELDDHAEVRVKRCTVEGDIISTNTIAMNKNSRSGGFPRIGLVDNRLLVAWTDATDGLTRVRTSMLDLNQSL